MMHKVEVVKKLNEQGYDAKIDGHGSIIVLVPEGTNMDKEFARYKKALKEMGYDFGSYGMRMVKRKHEDRED